MNLFELTATLTLDNSEYEKKIDQSGKSAKSVTSGMSTSFKSAGKAIGAVVGVIVGVSAAIAKVTTSVADYTGEIDDNSQRVGMSTEAYQKWAYAMTLAGGDASTLQVAIRGMNTFIEQLSAGQGDALLTLQKLGIGYEEFMAMPVDQQLQAIVEGLQGMENQTDKTTIAQDIFGSRAYQTLMPILNQEKGYIDELFTSMEDLGLVMSDDLIKAGAALGDSLDKLKLTIRTVGTILVGNLFPDIQKVIEGLTGLAAGSENATETLTAGIDGIFNKIVSGIPSLLDKIEAVLPDLIDGIFDSLMKIDWGSLIIDLLDFIINVGFIKIPKVIGDALTGLLNDVIDLFTTKDGLKKIGEFGESLGKSIINGLVGMLEVGVNVTIDAINGLTAGISKIWTWTGLDPIGQIKHVDWTPVPFAEGGMFPDSVGTLYALAGENGAEIVARGARGTGVANVEQIADAQYIAMNEYDVKSEIRRAAVAIVNGMKGSSGSIGDTNVVVRIGDKGFKSYVVQVVNETLKAQGRKTLNNVTAY